MHSYIFFIFLAMACIILSSQAYSLNCIDENGNSYTLKPGDSNTMDCTVSSDQQIPSGTYKAGVFTIETGVTLTVTQTSSHKHMEGCGDRGNGGKGHNNNGGRGGHGGLADHAGQDGADGKCCSGDGDCSGEKGVGGEAGGSIKINADYVFIEGTLNISGNPGTDGTNGEYSSCDWNTPDEGGSGGGGGGGGGGGELEITAHGFAGKGMVLARGGDGGNGDWGAGDNDDTNTDDDGGGGGGGGGGSGGKITIKVKDLSSRFYKSSSEGYDLSGGAGGSGGASSSQADDGEEGDPGCEGKVDYAQYDNLIEQSDAEDTIGLCNDGVDNDFNGLIDMDDPGCYQPAGACPSSNYGPRTEEQYATQASQSWYDRSATDGSDGCCGDDSSDTTTQDINGDFETDLSGWVNDDSYGNKDMGRANDNSYTGDWSAKGSILSGEAVALRYDLTGLVPGEYLFVVSMYDDMTDGGPFFHIDQEYGYGACVEGTASDGSEDGTWITKACTYDVGLSGEASIYLESGKDQRFGPEPVGDLWFDNIQVYQMSGGDYGYSSAPYLCHKPEEDHYWSDAGQNSFQIFQLGLQDAPNYCGDGVRGADEQCDEGSSNGDIPARQQCDSVEYCNVQCHVRSTDPINTCGDGNVACDETCETGDNPDLTPNPGCSSSLPYCYKSCSQCVDCVYDRHCNDDDICYENECVDPGQDVPSD